MTKKHSKKNIGTRKTYHTYLVGKGVTQIHEKIDVSVGLFSKFRHPLGDVMQVGPENDSSSSSCLFLPRFRWSLSTPLQTRTELLGVGASSV